MAKRIQSLGFRGTDAKRVLTEVSEIDSVKAGIQSKFSNDNASDDSKDKPSEAPPKVIEGNDSEEKPKEESKDQPLNATTLTVDSSVLQSLIDSAISKVAEPLKAKVAEQEKEIEAKDSAVEEANEKLKVSEDSAKKLADLFSQVGTQTTEDKAVAPTERFPNVNLKYGVDSGLIGAAKEFVGLLESDTYTPSRTILDQQGMIRVQRDYRQLTSFWKEHKDQVRNDMELFAKKAGLLQGWKAKDFNADAATLKVNLPDAFLVYLSTVMRETHIPSFIYWQFCFEKLELGKQPGDSILVPRFSYLPTPTNAASRRLTPGTPIGSARQPINQNSVGLQLEELGLDVPVAIPEFINAYSMLELESVVQRNIGYDYQFYDDMRIRALFAATTRVVYPNKTEVADTPAQLAAGSKGQINEGFLNSLFAYMRAMQIPTYDNGCYALVLNTFALKQLQNDLISRKQVISAANMEDIMNVLNAAKAGEMGKVSGYMGTLCNFMIFETNVHSLGAVGTEGVQSETIAGSAKVTRSSYAFGRNAIAKATGMAMEVRRDEMRDFGRMDSYTWLAHGTYGHLDTDSAIDPKQQTRVINIRTSDVEL